MKIALITISLFFGACSTMAQSWTSAQLQKANTAADEYKLTDAEKKTILYINLCRLYPAQFAQNELTPYTGIPRVVDPNFEQYKTSLLQELKTMAPAPALQPDELLYDDARCYGNEIATNKRKPHERVDCIKRNYAECLYYGKGEAIHVALQWLIDSGVESLGHRRICLATGYRKIGIKINAHPDYGHCAVAEFDK